MLVRRDPVSQMCAIAHQIVTNSPKHLALPLLLLPLLLLFLSNSLSPPSSLFFLSPFFLSSLLLPLSPSSLLPLPFSPPLPPPSAVFDTIEQYAPGFRDLVVGWETLTPPDLERTFGLTGGVKHSLIPKPHGNEAGYLTLDCILIMYLPAQVCRSTLPLIIKWSSYILQWNSDNILVSLMCLITTHSLPHLLG